MSNENQKPLDAKIQAAISKLLRTADGVPIVPGMEVHYTTGVESRPVERSTVQSVGVTALGKKWWAGAAGTTPHCVDKGGEPCWSTKGRALQHYAFQMAAKAHEAAREAREAREAEDDE